MKINNLADIGWLEEIVATAGQIAMKYFRSDNEVWIKSGNSPVSRADVEVNAYLQEQLLSIRPDYGWLSEETEDDQERLDRKRVFIVDPVDGTRGFISGMDEWCISVAIVEEGKPVAAVLECPALGERYCTKAGGETFLNGEVIHVSQSSEVRSVAGSRIINGALAANTAAGRQIQAGKQVSSLAYRLAMVAKGMIDVAFVQPGSHDWDLAAADLILANSGGKLINLQEGTLCYNQESIGHGALIACPSSLCESALKLAQVTGVFGSTIDFGVN